MTVDDQAVGQDAARPAAARQHRAPQGGGLDGGTPPGHALRRRRRPTTTSRSRSSCPSAGARRPAPRSARRACRTPRSTTPPCAHAARTLRIAGLDDDGRARRGRRDLRGPRAARVAAISRRRASSFPTSAQTLEPRRDPHDDLLGRRRPLAVGALVVGGVTLLSTLLVDSSSTPDAREQRHDAGRARPRARRAST